MEHTYAIRVYKEYFNFAACHFLIFADGTREPLHGHNYQVQVKVDGDVVEGDIVIDFIPFKPMVKRFCDEIDHLTLLPEFNPHLRSRKQTEGSRSPIRMAVIFVSRHRMSGFYPCPTRLPKCLRRISQRKSCKESSTKFPKPKCMHLKFRSPRAPGSQEFVALSSRARGAIPFECV